jgi:hypothetical protein
MEFEVAMCLHWRVLPRRGTFAAARRVYLSPLARRMALASASSEDMCLAGTCS